MTDYLEAYSHCDPPIVLLNMHATLMGDDYDAAIRVGPIVYESLAEKLFASVCSALYWRAGAPAIALVDQPSSPFALRRRGKRPEPSQ